MRARRTCRSSSRSTRSTRAMRIRIASATISRKHNVIPEEWGGDKLFVQRVRAHRRRASTSCSRPILLQAEVLDLKAPTRRPGGRRRARVEHREGPRRRRDRARQARHAAAGRPDHRRPGIRPRARACSTRPGSRSTRSRSVAARCVVLGLSGHAERRRRAARARERAQGTRSGAVSPGQVPRRQARQAGTDKARRRVLAAGRGQSDDASSSSSRRTCRAAPKRCATRSRSSATDEVSVKVIASGVGGITESDVTLAAASQGHASSASTCAPTARPAPRSRNRGVDVRYYSIIYEAIDDVRRR